MPYEHIEQIEDRSQERFAIGLGARNVVGVMVALFPILLLTGGWPAHMRVPALVAGAAAGLLATAELRGLSAYEWPLWWLRGRARATLSGRRVTERDLPQAHAPRGGGRRAVL